RQHNAEFTLIEWYRLGFRLDQLMDEVDSLVRHLLGSVAAGFRSERLTYREAMLRSLAVDPFTASESDLAPVARSLGFNDTTRGSRAHSELNDSAGRDELLEFLMGVHVGPRLGGDALTFVHSYPATQAALARLDPRDPRAALRFELYCQGMELANGFQELASA